VVIFCNGDFWHGRNWSNLQDKLANGANSSYWLAKIATNRERDFRVTSELTASGWDVLRIWETDILSDIESIAQNIFAHVKGKIS
jgi:DNA mismatch endonuclease (patch repair protein)